MIELPVIHFDCLHFYGDRPCKPNKEFGVFCGKCSYYEKDEALKNPFPAIPQTPAHTDTDGEKRIIIVKLDAVGDVLRTTSILPSIKEKYVDSNITWITKERSYEVLKDNDMIDEIYFTTDDLDNIYKETFDVAVNLDSGSDSCEIMSRIRSKYSCGYTLINGKPYPINSAANEWYLMGVDDVSKRQNTKTYHLIIHEICNLPYENSEPYIYLPPEKRRRAEEISAKYDLGNYNRMILVNLGGGNRWQYKKWTSDGYLKLAEILSGKYADTAIGIIAGDEDREFYEVISTELEKLSRENIKFFGTENSMEDFICIVSLAREVFTSDSLCFHIATALGKYTVVIVGPTSHTELDVFGNGRVIYSNKVDCLCCYLNTCPKTVTCMNTLDAEDISELFSVN
ncbi:MAG: glycosyltransferase family 9 protein [Ignavibacteria bacterium]|nr:glycosyltransferase family 9 protein [Ignavibacteria bacterium]